MCVCVLQQAEGKIGREKSRYLKLHGSFYYLSPAISTLPRGVASLRSNESTIREFVVDQLTQRIDHPAVVSPPPSSRGGKIEKPLSFSLSLSLSRSFNVKGNVVIFYRKERERERDGAVLIFLKRAAFLIRGIVSRPV